MKISILIFLLLSITFAAHAQTLQFDWAVKNGGPQGSDNISSATLSSDNDLYVANRIPIVISSSIGTGISFSRYDNFGNIWWTKTIRSSSNLQANGLKSIDSTGVVVVASIQGSVDFTPLGDSTSYSSQSGKVNPVIFKLNKAGKIVWLKQLLGVGNATPFAMDIDLQGNIIIAGNITNGTVDFDPGTGITNLSNTGTNQHLFVAKYNSTGSLLWAKKTTGTNGFIRPRRIVCDQNNNINLALNFAGNHDIDLSSALKYHSTAGSQIQDFLLIQYDTSGQLIWDKQIGGSGIDQINGLSLNSQSELVAVGTFNGSVDFDPSSSTKNFNSQLSKDIFIVKFDNSGNLIWAKALQSINNKNAFDVYFSQNDEIYIAGQYLSTLDFDPNAGTKTGIANFTNCFQLKLDNNGNYKWFLEIEHTGTTNNMRIFKSTTDGIFTVGTFSGVAKDFDPGNGSFSLSASNQDCFVQKIREIPFPQSVNYFTKKQIQVNPNPTQNEINITSNLKNFKLNIYSYQGHKVYHSNKTHHNNCSIDISNLANGIYFIKLLSNENPPIIDRFIKK
jgi:hypothetical protein